MPASSDVGENIRDLLESNKKKKKKRSRKQILAIALSQAEKEKVKNDSKGSLDSLVNELSDVLKSCM